MEVNRTNFSEVLDDLKRRVIAESSFLAIDGEFTGLSAGPEGAAFDTPSEYYAKIRQGSMNFLFIQFGLCAFKYDEAERKWTHNAYNFYVFPKPFHRRADTRFLCQASSIEFLSDNKFDFNKLFSRGIPYMSATEEQKERDFLQERQNKEKAQKNSTTGKDGGNNVPIPDDLVDYVANFCTSVDEFLESSQPTMEVKSTNAFQRKLLYQTAEEKYSKQVVLETRPIEGGRLLVVSRIQSEQDRVRLEEERHEKERRELDEAVGFSKLMRLLSSSNKLIVGHNMLLDMCHMLDKFCARLPVDYEEFKHMASTAFPRIIDTKYMSGCQHFKELIHSNVLCDLRTTLQQEPFTNTIIEVEDAGYPADAEKFHEAGYDAFVTGQCFITMANYLDKEGLHPSLQDLPLLKPYLNKILLMRIQDYCYMNLSGNDPVMPRDHVFHVTFPREWKHYDIVNLFKPVGPVYISWLSDSSAYVSLHEREKAASAMKALPRSSDYSVISYHAHHKQSDQSAISTPQSPAQRRTQAETLKRKHNSFSNKESKLTRRSINTIAEEDASDMSPAPKPARASSHFPETDHWG